MSKLLARLREMAGTVTAPPPRCPQDGAHGRLYSTATWGGNPPGAWWCPAQPHTGSRFFTPEQIEAAAAA